jgi:hypothetical protein
VLRWVNSGIKMVTAMAEKRDKGKKFKHWRYFIPESIARIKSKKRLENGVCIACGKQPCECKKIYPKVSKS